MKSKSYLKTCISTGPTETSIRGIRIRCPIETRLKFHDPLVSV